METGSDRKKRGFGTPAVGMLGLVLSLALGLSGCTEIIDALDVEMPAGQYVIWITASQDTYSSCGRTAGCEEGDLTFGRHGFLVVAEGILGHKRTYVNYDVSWLPEGTVVEEAHFELYHPAKTEDGQTDDISMSVAAIFDAPWTETTLSWNNPPVQGVGTPIGASSLQLRSLDWSRSSELKGTIQRAIDNPGTFDGFDIHLAPRFFNTQFEKGFYSTNYTNRARDDFDRAPRLLMKVTIPAGSPSPQLLFPTSVVNAGATVRYLSQSGTEYPEAWDVTP